MNRFVVSSEVHIRPLVRGRFLGIVIELRYLERYLLRLRRSPRSSIPTVVKQMSKWHDSFKSTTGSRL